MRKFLVLFAVLGLLAASCGGDSGADSCEGVADEFIVIMQEVIDELDTMSLEDLDSAETPPALEDLDQKGDALQTKADDLNCSDAEMEELVTARVGNLTSDGLLGQFLIDEAQSGGFFEE
ncbi:MAG: hypothetical protein U9N84_04645 [Actinomycetota bacterium]|nr:hypothetical protein [Actinomycetota bacterium]